LETSILPVRLANYSPGSLDTLIAAGEVVWCGLDSLGEHDGRVALFLSERLRTLLPPRPEASADNPLTPREHQLLEQMSRSGAAFFAQLHEAVGGGYPGETLDALWSLVWRGLVTNDTFHALRAYVARPTTSRLPKRQHNLPSFRSRRTTPPSAQGRWSLVPVPTVTPTEWSHAVAHQLLNRYGVLTRESAANENLPGGFSAIYDVLKALEESGRIRRGYFVAGLGATQFALPAAVDLLRSLRNGPPPEKPEILMLAATDPANLYGSVLRWPAITSQPEEEGPRSPTRSVGASVVLRNGEMVAYLRRNQPNLQVFLPADEPERSATARDLSLFLASLAQQDMDRREDMRGGMLISAINGQPAAQHGFAPFLQDAGFHVAPLGLNFRRVAASVLSQPPAANVQ
jgi:ATP-dependent Lhr-like helicase